jgi:2-polyprenyl-3-methyl-5-hydroxy-6-metoxy-1,4-benzoquinol methylase
MNESNPGGSFLPPSDDFNHALAAYRQNGSHWSRYSFARRLCADRTVLDIGCGYGYGAAILSPLFRSYTGMDADRSAIQWASRVVSDKVSGTRFLDIDASSQALAGKTFETVLCFEVLEHVPAPRELLGMVLRFLAPGGVALLSTPNGIISQGDSKRFRSPFHVREYTASEVASMVQELGFGVRFYKEHRKDRLDAIALRWGMGEHRQRAPGGLRARAFAWFAERFDGPAFWTITTADPGEMMSPGYSTILVELVALVRPSPGVPV